MNLEQLTKQIAKVDLLFQKRANSAINLSLTLRNWFIGYYIVEYEQQGEDRAKYGARILRTLSPILVELPIRGTLSPELRNTEFIVPAEKILTNLSYSHFEELVQIENPLKRAFYEIECINGVWSLRELRRQISSLYYERLGLSFNKEKLSELANKNAETIQASDLILLYEVISPWFSLN